MRTTLNLDDDVAIELGEQARREGRSMSRVANDLMRAAMTARGRDQRTLPPYEVQVFDTGAPRLDVTDVSTVLDVLDDA